MSEAPSPQPTEGRTRRVSVWLLGAISVFGLIGFILAFGMILARTVPGPRAAAPLNAAPLAALPAVAPQPGPRGERGAQGPPGPRGPAGESGIRIVRADCPGGNCTVECEADELLLMAHCGVGRGPATVQSERSALCRAPSRTKLDIIAACVKATAQ